MINQFGIEKFLGAFGYGEISIFHNQSRTVGDPPGLLLTSQTHRQFVSSLEEQLTTLAGWRCADNKIAFLWLSDDGQMNLASFYDFKFTHLSWHPGTPAAPEKYWGRKIPANVMGGRNLVIAMIDDYLSGKKE